LVISNTDNYTANILHSGSIILQVLYFKQTTLLSAVPLFSKDLHEYVKACKSLLISVQWKAPLPQIWNYFLPK